jgi:hypothetical protein
VPHLNSWAGAAQEDQRRTAGSVSRRGGQNAKNGNPDFSAQTVLADEIIRVTWEGFESSAAAGNLRFDFYGDGRMCGSLGSAGSR